MKHSYLIKEASELPDALTGDNYRRDQPGAAAA